MNANANEQSERVTTGTGVVFEQEGDYAGGSWDAGTMKLVSSPAAPLPCATKDNEVAGVPCKVVMPTWSVPDVTQREEVRASHF